MNEATQLLKAVAAGDRQAGEDLLPLVYDELRRIARFRMAKLPQGHTLQPTALVHEAWLRLINRDETSWKSRSHFIVAAAEAMRRIIVERIRRQNRMRHGGVQRRTEIDLVELPATTANDKLLAIHDVLDRLASEDPPKAKVVKLRVFVGLGHDEIANILGVSEKTIKRYWRDAKDWLFEAIQADLDV